MVAKWGSRHLPPRIHYCFWDLMVKVTNARPAGPIIYEDNDYGGRQQELIADGKCHDISDALNDRMSSMRFNGHKGTVHLFAERDCTIHSEKVSINYESGDQPAMTGYPFANSSGQIGTWDDKPTSYRIDNAPPPVQPSRNCGGNSTAYFAVPIDVQSTATTLCKGGVLTK